MSALFFLQMTPIGCLTRDGSSVALSFDEGANGSDDAASDEADEQFQRNEGQQQRDEDGGESDS